jgi:hypothetical protein
MGSFMGVNESGLCKCSLQLSRERITQKLQDAASILQI